jgi:hypothetical protein
MDPLGTGGIIVGTDMRLLDGCGSRADDADDAAEWLVSLPPATAQKPFPAPAVARGAYSCFHNGIFACGVCCDNAADVGPGVTYASIPKP